MLVGCFALSHADPFEMLQFLWASKLNIWPKVTIFNSTPTFAVYFKPNITVKGG